MRRAIGLLLAAAAGVPLALGAAPTPGDGLPVHPDIPPAAVAGYVAGAAHAADRDRGCAPHWSLLAGIGKVESDHGRVHGGALAPDGRAVPPILGVPLDGRLPGTAVVGDTDGGRLDGDPAVDRAVGPMQVLPGTWAAHQQDVDGDGTADPQDVDDASGTAAALLCAALGARAPAGPTAAGPAGSAAAADDISTEEGRRRALLAYNRSAAYAEAVADWADRYAAEAVIPAAVVDPGTGPIACPVTPPVRFIDSWHFPRSGGRLHQGQDLFAAEGQPLVAVAAGTVTEVRTGAGLGGTVLWLRTDDGHHWYYAHLRSFAPGLAAGDRVARGEVVGTVGRTGNAATTPPHLHIQWRPTGRRGADVNPYALLSAACPGHR